jgi:hypothetical protein
LHCDHPGHDFDRFGTDELQLNGTNGRSASTWYGIWISSGVLWVAEYFNGVIDDARIYNRALTPDEITAFATAPLPSLRVNLTVSFDTASQSVRITWPTSATGFALESSSTLPPATWTVSQAPAVQGSLNVVSQPATGGPRFYRLKK